MTKEEILKELEKDLTIKELEQLYYQAQQFNINYNN
jgi:hypothetical protein